MKSKKAISPLIATVLIIGFTIVLAAVVIQWGGQLVDQLKGQTQTSTELSLACSSGLSELDISKVDKIESATAESEDTLKLTMDNKNEQLVAGIIVRKYHTDGSVSTWEATDDPLTTTVDEREMKSFEVRSYTIPMNLDAGVATESFRSTTTVLKINKVGVMPKVKLSDGSDKVCSKELTYNI